MLYLVDLSILLLHHLLYVVNLLIVALTNDSLLSASVLLLQQLNVLIVQLDISLLQLLHVSLLILVLLLGCSQFSVHLLTLQAQRLYLLNCLYQILLQLSHLLQTSLPNAFLLQFEGVVQL